ncbi:MAG: hypothetical protein ACP5U2_12705 [Bryobacteraceae bacterium]
MKAVQVGILVLLVVVAGLLYMNLRSKTSQPAAVPASGEAAIAPAAQTAQPEAAQPAAAQPAPSAAAEPQLAQPAAPARKRPSPAPVRAGQPAASSQAPVGTQPAQSAPAVTAQSTEPSQPEAKPTATVLTPPPGAQPAPPPAPAPRKVTIPAGTLLTVRLNETISSEKNQPGDTFSATLDQPLIVEGLVLAERGARVQGKVLEVERSGRVRGRASLKIHLVRIHTADGQDVTISTEPFSKTAEASTADDAKKVGIGAAVGAAIGAIAGGGRGAAIGAGVGGAAGTGTVLATRGKPAVLPSETRLTFRLQEPVTVVEKVR